VRSNWLASTDPPRRAIADSRSATNSASQNRSKISTIAAASTAPPVADR
jgi:hypothetical protein